MEILYFFIAGLVAGAFGYLATRNKYAALLMFAVWPLAYLLGRPLTETLISALHANLLTVIAVIDLERLVIPNRLVLAVLLLSLPELILRIEPIWYDRLAGVAVAGGLLALILIVGGRAYGKNVLGWGDVKLAAACGLLLGWRLALLSLFAAALAAVLEITALRVFRKAPERGAGLPFAPALAVGVTICRYWGSNLLSLIMPG